MSCSVQASILPFATSHCVSGIEKKVYAAFSPTQIKSATGNNGEYSRTNPDIRYSDAPRPETTANKQAGYAIVKEVIGLVLLR